MNIYLKFNGEQDATNAANKIWYNRLILEANNNEKIVGDGNGNDYYLSDLQQMTEENTIKLKLYGKKNNDIQNTSAFTVKEVGIIECLNEPNNFIFKKPNSDLLQNVINYTEEEYNENWFPKRQ